jgi:alkanesulfonate monooxygenase SsuD/methylene tetrahydromethanopterin reductase-like flavin-dependent oxidoreductase (luciferase family)
VLLPMLAQATSRIRVGFNVLVTPWAHPFLWAKYIASLDAASGGRIIAGFGLGHGPTGGPIKALDNIGIDGTKRGKMSDEALDIIVKLWQAEDVISFEGEFYRGVDLAIAPKPLQKPYPEIWWAGRATPSIRRAAQYNAMLEVTWPPLRKVREEYAPGLATANRKYGSRSKLAICMYAGLFAKRIDREELSRHYFGWRGEALEPIAAGDPEQCAEVLRDYRAAGIEHFVLDFHRHGLDSVRVLHDQMERFARDVLPLLG